MAVSLTPADKKLYEVMFASVLIPYSRLTFGETLGEGLLLIVSDCFAQHALLQEPLGRLFKDSCYRPVMRLQKSPSKL